MNIFWHKSIGSAFNLIGTSLLSQFLLILATPVLANLYGPQQLGAASFYYAAFSIFSLVSSFRYDQALLIDSRKRLNGNYILSCLIASLSSIMFIVVFALLWPVGQRLWSIPNEFKSLVSLSIISGWASSCFNISSNYLIRRSLSKQLALIRLFQTLLLLAAQFSFYKFFDVGYSFVLADSCARVVAASAIGITLYTRIIAKKNQIRLPYLIRLAMYNLKLPMLYLPSSLLNLASFQIQPMLFPLKYGEFAAGNFFMAQRVLQLPLSIVVNAVSDVTKPKISDSLNKSKESSRLFLKLTVVLTIVALIFSALLFTLAPAILGILLDSQWALSIQFMMLLIPMNAFRIVASPLSFYVIASKKFRADIVGNLLMSLFSLISILCFESYYNSILFFSLSFSLIYCMYFIFSWNISSPTSRHVSCNS